MGTDSETARRSRMPGWRGIRFVAGTTAITALIAASFVTGAEPTGAVASVWPMWKTMRLKATTALVLSGHVDITAVPDGDMTRLETTIRAKLFGMTIAKTHTRSMVDPVTSLPREYLAFSTKRGRHYIFGSKGYEVKILDPARELDAPIEEWKVTGIRKYDYPVAEDGSGPIPVYDYYGVILRMRTLGLDAIGDEQTIWVATSDGPVPYAIRVVESRQLARKFTELPAKKKRSIAVTELMLKIIPLDPEEEQGFLGMKGETQVWIEQRTKTIVQISGRAPRAGWIDIMLNSLERARPAPTTAGR